MMPLRRLAFVFAALSLALPSCKEKSAPVAKAPEPEASGPLEHKWPPQGSSKVVAYRFVNPEGPGEGNFSLIEGSGVDLEKLKSMTVASAELNDEQSARLVQCIIGEHRRMVSAACYDPHHIFVFYNAKGDVVNAVEICFGCTSVHALPDVGQEQWWHHDFRGLVRLCEEVGIGMDHGTAADFIAKWDEEEKSEEALAPSGTDEDDAHGDGH